MAAKPTTINKELETAIKNALKLTKEKTPEGAPMMDIKEQMMVINAAIKYEAVRLKMADQDFGSHFIDNEEDEEN
jgi:hypothetical protein